MLKMAKLEFENHKNISLGCLDPSTLRQIFLEIAWQNWPFKIGLSLLDFKQDQYDVKAYGKIKVLKKKLPKASESGNLTRQGMAPFSGYHREGGNRRCWLRLRWRRLESRVARGPSLAFSTNNIFRSIPPPWKGFHCLIKEFSCISQFSLWFSIKFLEGPLDKKKVMEFILQWHLTRSSFSFSSPHILGVKYSD